MIGWNNEEDELLIKNKDKTIEELMDIFPNRRPNTIYYRKHKLRLVKDKTWTEEELQTVYYNLDKTDKEIAKLINRSATSISQRRKKKRWLKLTPVKHKWTEEDRNFLIKHYSTMTFEELAEHFNVSRKRIYETYIYMGLIKRCRTGKPWTVKDTSKLKIMVDENKSINEISEVFSDRTNQAIIGKRRKYIKKANKKEFRERKGYLEIFVDTKYIAYHRYLMEQFTGKPLPPNIHIHHLDFNKKNNQIYNLIMLSKGQHSHVHREIKKLVKPLMDAGFITYDIYFNEYVLIKCKTVFEQRKKIFEDFNNHVNDYVENTIKNIDNSMEITKILLTKYGYITTTETRWTEKETNFIKDNPNLTMSTITIILASRTERSIGHKLSQLGYKTKKKEILEYYSHGYRIIKIDGKGIPEHRYKAQLILGRVLDGEDVHHISHIKTDNRPKNLVIFSDTKERSARSAHIIAGETFNHCIPDLYNRGIVLYSPEQKSYILGENFIANDKNYELTL